MSRMSTMNHLRRWIAWNRGAAAILTITVAVIVYGVLETIFFGYEPSPFLFAVEYAAVLAVVVPPILWYRRGRWIFGPPPIRVGRSWGITSPSPVPRADARTSEPIVVVQREVIERQVVVVRCKYCGELTPVDRLTCKNCGASAPG